MQTRWKVIAVLFSTMFSSPAFSVSVTSPDQEIRLEQLVEANILAVHAYQIGLVKKTEKGSPQCYASGGLSDQQLEQIVAHQASLLGTPPDVLLAWIQGKQSSLEPSAHLLPILGSQLSIPENAPISVITRYLAAHSKAPRSHLRAIANLYQTILEVERDGDLLQQEFDLYVALGLPVYIGQFKLPGSDESLLVAGRKLASQTCSSPFDTDAAAWQIAGRKIWNWGEKKLHIRDAQVLAREWLAEPEVRPLISRMRALPPQRIAVIGHSFTMDLHWSSPSSFGAVVTVMFARENARVQFRQFQAGGLTASRVLKNFYPDALAWKPDEVLLVVMARQEEDYEALKTMGEGFTRAGIRSFVFDNVRDPETTDPEKIARFNKVARQAGITVIEVETLLSKSPDRDQFLCLDRIHMKEPYHRLMAREWLKFLVGARGAEL